MSEKPLEVSIGSGYLCQGCKKELEFHQKVIRKEQKWYHPGCWKEHPVSAPEEKTEFQLIEAHPLDTNDVKTPKILKCIFCADKIEDGEEKVSFGKQSYHSVCYELSEYEVPKKTKEVTEKKKAVGKIDPVLILIMIGIFSTLFVTAYLMLSTVSMIAIGVGMVLSFYHVIDSARSVRKKKVRNIPSYFVLITVAMPVVFGAIMSYEGYNHWQSIPKAVIVWGLTLTFWSNMVFIPLAVYSKYKETAPLEKTFKPLVSIIVPAYNEEKVIARTVESILSTDYPRREIIVVDDGSTDRTLKILETYKPKIKLIHKENGGKFTALNYGLLYAKGEIVVTVDADTILAPQSITTVVQGFRDKNVGAVAGNIKVRNRTNILTWCQALEYVAGIQIFRRTLDFFNSVSIVPGALGAFRKNILQRVGNFSGDTLAEDFDATLKILKSGKVVGGRIDSRAYTESPDTLYQFYKQRSRWFRGDMQVLLKHRNSLSNSQFGALYKLTFPLMIISMFVTPFAGIVVWTFSILDILGGGIHFVLQMMGIFILLQYLHAALAVRIEGEDPRLVLFSIFFVVGYKQLIDVLLMRAAIQTLLRRKAMWTTVKRQGIKR